VSEKAQHLLAERTPLLRSGRGTETEEVIQTRMRNAVREIESAKTSGVRRVPL
jgi:hypothetical protein